MYITVTGTVRGLRNLELTSISRSKHGLGVESTEAEESAGSGIRMVRQFSNVEVAPCIGVIWSQPLGCGGGPPNGIPSSCK